MNSAHKLWLAAVGLLGLVIGAAGLIFIGYSIYLYGAAFFIRPESLLFAYVFSATLLVASFGLSFLLRTAPNTKQSLWLRFAFVVCGIVIVVVGLGIAYYGDPRTPQGALAPALLGAYLAWRGLRNAA